MNRIGKCASESKEYNCYRCHRRFFSVECMKNHRIVQGNEKKSICDLVKLCTRCGQHLKSERKIMSAKERKNVIFASKLLTFHIDVIFSLTKVR